MKKIGALILPIKRCSYIRPTQYLIINNNLKISYSSSKISNYCWKCGVERTNANMFCEKCNIIQNPQEKNNYFKILDIKQGFNIDQKMLKDKFRSFQSQIHPDKFSNSTEKEQTISEEYSSLINKAYSNLMSPMKRAEHLLQLNGESIAENQTVDEPAFLMNIMNRNEEVENSQQDIEKLKQLDKKKNLVISKLGCHNFS